MLIWATHLPIHLTEGNADYYVNLLWPLGLANYMSANESSPMNGDSLYNFASTGGWTMGKEQNGGSYFNKFRIVEWTTEQVAMVIKVAKSTYLSSCNKSNFSQVSNH